MHAVQALALELAEGLAERTHQVIRDKWGFPDPVDFTMEKRFQAKYQGQRYSFGYPACPNLEDQEKLFHLPQPRKNRDSSHRRVYDGARSIRFSHCRFSS